MGKILLFYKYTDISTPESITKWQRGLCESLDLKGRVLIAYEGINGTLGGSKESIEKYIATMKSHELFADIDFKESDGNADYFPRLEIKTKKEIVNFGVDPKVISAEDAGAYLTPKEAHELINHNPEDLVLFDARNDYESRVGTFTNSITPDIKNFRDLPKYIDENPHLFENKKVVMFCTGGVRCERATAYLKKKNIAKDVLHIKGGIHRYIEEFPNGHFKGKNYVFDGRITVKVSEDILGKCQHCSIPYDDYTNCINAECNIQIIVCKNCIDSYHNTCSTKCMALVDAKKVNIRTKVHKISITHEAITDEDFKQATNFTEMV